jgi:hypothetical protein
LAQPTGPIVGATNKPSGSVKLGVGAEIRPVARHGIAQFRRRRYCQGTGRGATCKSYGVSNEKKKRKMSVLLAFCHTFIYCIYPRQKPINCWRFGLFHINRPGHGGFYRTMFGINSIYSLRTPNSTFFPSKCSKRAFLTECWPR